MAESIIQPLDAEDLLYKYSRRQWRAAGVDNFVLPPNENEDDFEIMQNWLPPMTNVLQRRFGYATFVPKLDTGVAAGSDLVPQTALFGAQFDGEAGYVSTSKSYTYNQTPVFSVEFWFETFSTTGGYFVSLNASQLITSSETQYFGIYMTTAGKIGVGYSNGAAVELSATTPLSYNDGLGHMVDVTVNGAAILIYVDGALVVTSTVSPAAGTHTSFWRLAEGPGGSGWPTGIDQFMQTFLSHVSVFNNIVLTGTQITAHYTAMTSLTGTQAIYETAVLADTPTYFWFLTDTLGSPPASNSVVVQNQTEDWIATSGGTQTMTFPNPVLANHVILVAVGNDFGNVTGVTDNQGNTYNSLNGASETGVSGYGLQTWFAVTTAAGALTLTFTNNAGATGNQQAIAFELQNTVIPTPIDGQNIASGNGVNITSGSITTADEPDIIFSFATCNRVMTLPPGQGFVLGATNSAINNRDGQTKTTAAAYKQTTALGSFACNWTAASSTVWLANTVGLQLNLPVANASGNTAFDSADSNTGTYQLTIIPNSVSTPSWTGTGTTTATMLATATAPGIFVGDTGFLVIQSAPSTLIVNSVTDSNGNTWTQQTPNGLALGTLAIFSIWTASMETAIAAGSTMTITVTFSANCSSPRGSFFNVPDISAVQIAAHATGTGTSPSTAGVTTTTATALFSFASAATTLTGFPATPFPAAPFILVTGTDGYAVDLALPAAPGTYIPIWTQTSSGLWVVQDIAFTTTPGFFLGEFIIVI